MKIALLDNITGFGDKDWSTHWVLLWFSCGVLALFYSFWTTTQQTPLDWFYFVVSIVGLLCIVGLSLRKNIIGNGLGLITTAGEVIVQGIAGAAGLMLAPLFGFLTHAYGIVYWSKNSDNTGHVIPRTADKYAWLFMLFAILGGLLFLPTVDGFLSSRGHCVIREDKTQLLGMLDFFWINAAVFVLSLTAQTAMILRYSFSWWLWSLVNIVWITVNIMTGNTVFVVQTVIYQINAFVGLYSWYRASQQLKSA